jgi:hypothetical protein
MHRPNAARIILLLCAAAWPSGAKATVYDLPADPVPDSLQSGDIVNLGVGGVLPDDYSFPPASVLNIHGGLVGPNFVTFLETYGDVNVFSYLDDPGFGLIVVCHDASVLNVFGGGISAGSYGGQVNVHGGELSWLFSMPGTVVNVQNGYLFMVEAPGQSQITISGGEVHMIRSPDRCQIDIIDGTVDAMADVKFSVVNMSGGSVGSATLSQGGEFNLSGGSLLAGFNMDSASELHITGTSFLVDGAQIPGLRAGHTVTIAERDVQLTGTLSDGSALSLNLGGWDVIRTRPRILPGAVITVTLVPEPASILLMWLGACFVTVLQRLKKRLSS